MQQWEAAQCDPELPTNNPLNDEAAVGMLTYRGVNYTIVPNANQTAQEIGIKTSDFSHQSEQATFQATAQFTDVRYPYWQFPYNWGPYSQQVIKIFPAGAYENQSNLGIVGRPRGINDWNTPLMTPYGVPPDETG